MAEVVKMPRLSDTMTDGVVAKWHKKIGDKVNEGDLLADIETDKATMEFESFQEGFLLHIGVKENGTAKVDSILAILGDENEDISSILSENDKEKSEKNTSSNDTAINKNDINQESGFDSIEEFLANEKNDTEASQNDDTIERIKISPLAKKIALEKNINISNIMGSGDNGRIVKRDVFNLDSSNEVRVEQTNLTPTNNLSDKFTEIPISQMRRTIATRLSQSKFTSPHFYLNIEVEMDNLIKLRKEINEKNEVKISFNDIIVKATSMAIQKHPHINSSWHDSHIKLHSNINIGVAVSVDNGLIVPVIKNSNFKSFTEISTITNDFVKKAKENKLQPSDWEGNTFTISNLGMFGIDDFTAIINPPDACILAVGAIKERPISKDGVIVSGNVMRLTLSSDHRIVDGVLGSKFLRTLKDMLEQPMMMFC